MSVREQYEQKAEAMAQPIIDQFGFELVDVEYVKEAGNWYLRFYIDKEGGITVDDCEAVSRIFSDKLDELDFIEDAYIMEVSSPGLGRPLKKEKDYVRSMGKEVVLIVDEFTGRIMPGRRYSDGLHQAIEAKEHVKVNLAVPWYDQ